MVGTFLFLTVCGLRNQIRVRLRRLREPRYLVGFLVGAAYLYFVVFARAFHPSPRPMGGSGAPTAVAVLARVGAPLLGFVGSVGLFAFAVVAWLWPGTRRPLEFARAEVQVLFTAPLTRRQLIHYKLLRSQLGLLFGSAVATMFLRPSTLVSGWMLLAGMWIALVAARLHFLGVSLSRASLAERGAGGAVRRWAPVAVVLGAIVTLALAAAGDWPAIAAATGPGEIVRELQRVWSFGASAWILWPFLALVRLPLAASPAEFARALPAALAIVTLNYAWVLQADASFEEAAADRAEKLATSRSAPRALRVKATPAPFALAAEGRPEFAIMWKNLILLGRYASPRTLFRLVPLVAVFGIAATSTAKNGGIVSLLAGFCLVAIGMVVLMGAQLARNDLRQDLARLAVLKTWPVSGATLLRGELAAPAAVLTAFAWLAILGAATLVTHLPGKGSAVFGLLLDRASYTIAGLLLAPALILVQLVVTNGVAVLFPAWIAIGASRARGIDAMGQRMLMMAGIWISLVVSLLPAALVAGLVGLAIYWTTHVIPVTVPALVASVVVVAECWVAVELLGRVLDRTDVSATEPVD